MKMFKVVCLPNSEYLVLSEVSAQFRCSLAHNGLGLHAKSMFRGGCACGAEFQIIFRNRKFTVMKDTRH